MQLILESETTDFQINGKMSVDQETVSEKITNGDVYANGNGDAIKADKENKECNENVNNVEKVTSSEQNDKTESVEDKTDQETIVNDTSDVVAAKENGTDKEESPKEDIQLESSKPVASENSNENNNSNESKEDIEGDDTKSKEIIKAVEDNEESKDNVILKEDELSKGNESSDNISNDETVLDEPLRFEDDDSLEGKVVENIHSNDQNPTAIIENVDVPSAEKENVEIVTEPSTKSNSDTESSETQINKVDLMKVENNEESLPLEKENVEIVTEPSIKSNSETELSETQMNKVDSMEVENNEESLPLDTQNDEIDSTKADNSETDLIKDQKEVTVSAGTPDGKVESTEIMKNLDDVIETLENEPSEIKIEKETEIKEKTPDDAMECDISAEEQTNEATNKAVDNIAVKTEDQDTEIEEKTSDDAMECDISAEEQTSEATNKAVDDIAVKTEAEELSETINDSLVSETPMECDDIVNPSQDRESNDKSTELPEVDDKVPETDSKTVNNDNSPLITKEQTVSSDTVDTKEPTVSSDLSDIIDSTKCGESIDKNEDIVPVSEAVSNSDAVVNETKSDDNKADSETELKDKTVEKVPVEVPDSSTECNDISIVEDSVVQDKAKPDEPVTVDLDESDDQQDEPVQVKETKVDKKISEPVCRLSNNLNILSDDEDEPSKEDSAPKPTEPVDKCIDLDDDDDIVLIDDVAATKTDEEAKESETSAPKMVVEDSVNVTDTAANEPALDKEPTEEITDSEDPKADVAPPAENIVDEDIGKVKKSKPLLPKDFFKTYQKNLTEMTRNELEEFCILKIVESIIDRSKLNDIRTKLKTMASNIEEQKKKTQSLAKQNRDLQVVLKSVQEEQKKQGGAPIAPLRITRSVGMQVLMTEKPTRRKGPMNTPQAGPSNQANANNRTNGQRTPVRQPIPRSIPVPKLVLANNTNNPTKPTTPTQVTVKPAKANSSPNVVKIQSPAKPEKRTHSQSVTVDLTDDEPPAKVVQRVSSGPVRMVTPHQMIKSPPATAAATNAAPSPRKVYIPIVQGQVRPGQMMVKNGPTPGPRPRGQQAPMVRVAQFGTRPRVATPRHPAPLPDTVKQYQPPNWKSLPPAPDLKLSKVENGIVISWKIDGYLEDSYEEIASYQLYAYQETTAPPSTSLWKKIGDVKALPLPMACTLTQFMAGYKYYFAVRAVDIRSRLGPFSLPGSILLLNKNY